MTYEDAINSCAFGAIHYFLLSQDSAMAVIKELRLSSGHLEPVARWLTSVQEDSEKCIPLNSVVGKCLFISSSTIKYCCAISVFLFILLRECVYKTSLIVMTIIITIIIKITFSVDSKGNNWEICIYCG